MDLFLNEQQQELANHHEGPCICTAVAGSGKTTAMVQNIINKINMGIAPESIIVTTFTKDAAEQIKDRLAKSIHIPKKRLDKCLIGTTHSIALKVLNIGTTKRFNLIAANSGNAKFYWDMRKKLLQHIESPHYTGVEDDYLRIFSYLKNRKMFPIDTPVMNELNFDTTLRRDDSWIKMLGNGQRPHHIKTAWKFYEQYKNEHDLVDYDDMLVQAYIMLETMPKLRSRLQDQYKYIMVDEYQDTNQIQYELFQILAQPQNNIVVVGDDDQSIYSFRGARPEYILKFPDDFEDAKVIKMEKNYRSQRMILRTANRLIVNNETRFEKMLRCTQQTLPIIPNFKFFENSTIEANFIMKHIKDKIIKDMDKPSTHAVLSRTNSQLIQPAMIALELNIPYTIAGAGDIFSRDEVKTVVNYMKICMNYQDSFQEMMQVVHKPFRGISKETLKPITNLYELEQCNDPKVCDFVSEMKSLHDEYKDPDSTDYEILEFIYGPMRLLRWAENKTKSDSNDSADEILIQILMVMKDRSFKDFIGQINKAREHNNKDGVVLSTIHRAKGLEWNNVYVIGCSDGLMPHVNADDIEEERRLMYVAITRARHNLHLSGFVYKKDKVLSISRFIKEVKVSLSGVSEAEEVYNTCHQREQFS